MQLFIPIAVASSLFSIQGILPFAPSLAHFTYVSGILAICIVAALLAILNWSLWINQLVQYVGKAIIYYNIRLGREVSGASIWTNPLKRRSSKRPGMVDRGLWDLEASYMDTYSRRPDIENDPNHNSTPQVSPPDCSPSKVPLLNDIDDSENGISTPVTEALDSVGSQFCLLEMNEDLLHPETYKTKLRGLQTHICQKSAIAQLSSKSPAVTFKPDVTPDAQFQECLRILQCIWHNCTVLRNSGFCSATATFLQIDPNRTDVAFLRSVELNKVLQLRSCIIDTDMSSKNLRALDVACTEILGSYLKPSHILKVGEFAIISLRVLDLALISHASSHVSDFYRWISEGTSIDQKFQISAQGSSIIDASALSEGGSLCFSRRTLKCLNGFLCGEKVWVLHNPNIDAMDPTELYLSTTPNAFADVWGPAWEITNAEEPREILRYDLEHGSIVPLGLIFGSDDHSVKAQPNEELCHWIPNSKLEDFNKSPAGTIPPQISKPHLLIGACHHSVTPNPENCYCNLTEANDRFISSRYRRIMGSSPVRWATASKTIGTAAGGAGVGAPTIQYSHTRKKYGTPVKEALYKRWKNNPPELRPWRILLMRFGLQVSICTGNSRKVRLVDLIAGDTMKAYMRTYPSYANESWRETFERMLDTDPAKLVDYNAGNALERKAIEQYITDCLDGLVHTGIGSRGNDPFVALWVYHGQPWEIAVPRHYYEWTGFAQDCDLACSFVVLEKCLVNEFGLGCCHPREDMSQEDIQRIRRDTPAMFETFLKISKDAEQTNGLCIRQKGDGRQYWSIKGLRNRKHCIRLGKQGKLEGEGLLCKKVRKGKPLCSKRILAGKWSPEGRVAATARVLSTAISTVETHTEHIFDGSRDEVSPLPYLVLDSP